MFQLGVRDSIKEAILSLCIPAVNVHLSRYNHEVPKIVSGGRFQIAVMQKFIPPSPPYALVAPF